MTVDRTNAADAGAETVEEPPAPERRPPPDKPGSDGAPSRADSRALAAAANGKPDVDRPEGSPAHEQPSSTCEESLVEDKPQPTRTAQPLGEDTQRSDVPDDAVSAPAETAETEQATAGTADPADSNDTAEQGQGPDAQTPESDGTDATAADDQPFSGETAEQPPGQTVEEPTPGDEGEPLDPSAEDAAGAMDTVPEIAEEPQDTPTPSRNARRDVVASAPEDEQSAGAPPEAVVPVRAGRDRTARAEGSTEASNPVQRTGTQESHESVLSSSGEQGASSRSEGTDTSDAASDRSGVTDDGGWEWKGLSLTPEENRIAYDAIEARRATEGRDVNGEYGYQGLTPEMRRVEQDLAYGELVADTEKYALKGEERFKEKLAKRIALEPDKPADQLAAEIHDGIRYTLTFPTEKYTPGMYDAEAKLRRRGYELRQRKPSWGDSEYKGVNSRWRDPDSSQLFEVQFHTPESWEAKQKTHDAYATIENPETSEAEKAAARRYQQEVSAAIPVPDGAAEIPQYKDEGR